MWVCDLREGMGVQGAMETSMWHGPQEELGMGSCKNLDFQSLQAKSQVALTKAPAQFPTQGEKSTPQAHFQGYAISLFHKSQAT